MMCFYSRFSFYSISQWCLYVCICHKWLFFWRTFTYFAELQLEILSDFILYDALVAFEQMMSNRNSLAFGCERVWKLLLRFMLFFFLVRCIKVELYDSSKNQIRSEKKFLKDLAQFELN